jgi:hypothetical protein
MAEKRVSVRLAAVGGRQVRAELDTRKNQGFGASRITAGSSIGPD